MAKSNYENDYCSVTQVLGVLRKIGLEFWFKYNTSKFCDEKSAKGKIIGTQIHEGIHSFIQTGTADVKTEYSEEVTNALKGFILFRKEHPEFELIIGEIPMTSKTYKCNGTLDCLAKLNTESIVFDWKSGECKKKDKPPIYDEHAMQVSAYVKFHNEINNANVEIAYILAIAKDKIAYNLVKLNKEAIESYFNDGFLPALTIFNLQKKGVLWKENDTI